jgi:hypothetical protein
VQGILRHAKIQTTLDLYAQDDGDETRAAQGEYLTALGVGTQSGLDCGLMFLGQHPVTYWKQMVGLGGLEPPTSPLSVLRSLLPEYYSSRYRMRSDSTIQS